MENAWFLSIVKATAKHFMYAKIMDDGCESLGRQAGCCKDFVKATKMHPQKMR